MCPLIYHWSKLFIETIERIDKELNDAKEEYRKADKKLEELKKNLRTLTREIRREKDEEKKKILEGDSKDLEEEIGELEKEREKLEGEKEVWRKEVLEWGKRLREFGGGEGNEQFPIEISCTEKTATFCATTRCSFPYVLYVHVRFFRTHSLHDPQFRTFCTCMYVFSVHEFSIGMCPQVEENECAPNDSVFIIPQIIGTSVLDTFDNISDFNQPSLFLQPLSQHASREIVKQFTKVEYSFWNTHYGIQLLDSLGGIPQFVVYLVDAVNELSDQNINEDSICFIDLSSYKP